MDGVPTYPQQRWPKERKFDRHELEGPVKLITPGGSVYRGWCKDVSEGGIGATVAAALRVGEEVSLEFQLPVCPEPLKLRAVLRYASKFYHGFEFITLSPQQRQLVRLHVESQQQRHHKKTSACP